MGLTSALNTAVFGIAFNQRQMDVAASNIANADTAGYSRKSVTAKAYFDGQGNVAGVISNEVIRNVDKQIQSDYFNSLADTNYGAQIAAFTNRLDGIFGTLGDGSGLSSLASKFTASLSSLVNQPGNYAAQKDVVASAEAMAHELNSAYSQIADLRQEADEALKQQTDNINDILAAIEDVDADIRDATVAGKSSAQMEDERDRLVERLSGYMDINVTETDQNSLFITTRQGQQLFADSKAATLSMTPTHTLRPGQTGNPVNISFSGATQLNLHAENQSGTLAATMELRDDVLVEALKQLDTIAAEMSLAFSNVDVASTAATVGLDSGFTLDVAGLQPGNTVSLAYTDTGGTPRTVTLMAVDDTSLLPLDNSATPDPNDTVVGIDISSGTPATYIANIVTALGATGLNTELLVANDGSNNLRILGDNTAPTSVQSLSANVTVTANNDQGLGLSIFVDQREGTEVFTDALENGGQRVGYASGIRVNPDLLANSALLTNYQTTPTPNSTSDPARPQYLLNAFSVSTTQFDASSGIGSSANPFEGSLIDYINQTVSYQGDQAADAKTYAQSKESLTQNLAVRYEQSYSVNLDAELAFLVQLENAYSANARVMQIIKELTDELLSIGR